MARINQTASAERFYRRWSPKVFGFCSLLLGNKVSAETVTAQAFRGYFERDLEPELVRLPDELMALAWDLCRPIASEGQGFGNGNSEKLDAAILRLPVEERAVFILRNVMAVDELDAGSILGLSLAALRRTWFRAMVDLRKLVPANFRKEQRA
jgi:hypothetical protein